MVSQQDWPDDEILVFNQQLKQVIKWTEKLSENFDFVNGYYGKVFRQTNPEVNGIKLYQVDGADYFTCNLNDYDPELYKYLLQQALQIRPDRSDIDLRHIDKWGRILTFETCITTHDGAPIVESECFLDESDVPPIDTWFYLKKNYFHTDYLCSQVLFCWIPKKFELVMQKGINVEIFDSYRWLDENDKIMYNRIKNYS